MDMMGSHETAGKTLLLKVRELLHGKAREREKHEEESGIDRHKDFIDTCQGTIHANIKAAEINQSERQSERSRFGHKSIQLLATLNMLS